MANLFKKAKAESTVSEKDSKTVIVNDPSFHENVKRIVEINAELSTLGAEASNLMGQVKEIATGKFIELFKSKGTYPGSFKIKTDGIEPGEFTFIPTDSYKKITEERYNELSGIYGTELVEEKTTYTMDSELVEMYGETISDLIETCKAIPDDVKKRLISASSAWKIKKGTITKLNERTEPMEQLLTDIAPTFQIKNIKVEEA